ncbi:Aldolase-type TIM barrel [Syntrophomonas zehnderi OL-4]|uniref:Aldolase-type TIM barrel n=1 Tax=Syntrophomonas zehnderi OL-4 TaxID=690567 RepID=A0A0E4C7H8_9FIRM|nr:radical SAM protein [Syntrophomonas zehnderi]CFX02068.1 Aldolase-type TIM barrel [Syntrophomonas zehnderi OL-4]
MINQAKKFVGEKAVTQATRYISKDPEKNLGKAISLAEKLAVREDHKKQIATVKTYLLDPESNWHELYVRTMTESNQNVRERLAVDFVINAVLAGIPRQYELAEKLGYSIPWAILIDPTDRCNLRCTGCWAGEYTKKNDLEYELLDRIIREGEELNIFFYVFSGGEPLVRKDDLLKLANSHPNSIFHVFTNGTLIDDEFAKACAKAGNITFAISIEGFEETTDFRRGAGTFQKVMQAADVLKEHGLIFGFSGTYHRKNAEEVTSDEFIDLLVDKGFRFGWYFTYVPVGSDTDLDFMATPEQRADVYWRIQHLRETKPIFLADFWNDGVTTGGCIAGGRRYFHINAAGDVEPCAFIHYATCNIRDMSVKEALGNQLFLEYQKRQPFNNNHMRPCPLIDNPDSLAACVNESCAYSTQNKSVDVNQIAQNLADYANAWGEKADQIVNEHFK